jgi:serine/threonine protein kinase
MRPGGELARGPGRPYLDGTVSDRTVLALLPPPGHDAPAGGPARVGLRIEHSRRYRLLAHIGEGGMGTVWRALDETLDREVALKFLKPDVPLAYRRRFRREARVGAQLDHANLVRVLDAGARARDEDEWIAMELLVGRDLGELVDTSGRLGVRVLLDAFRQALHGLAYLHTRRIVHRDIKPYNIFMAREPGGHGMRIKLIDFGICRNLGIPEPADEALVGDPRYMSPEQAVLGGPIDGRADLYALGVSLYQAATGLHPFHELFTAPVPLLLRAHREWAVPPASALLPGGVSRAFASGLDEVVHRACAIDPERRYADADAMADALDELARAAGTT